MVSTIFLSVSAIVYNIMLMFVFFTKKKIDTVENKIFTRLIIFSFGALFSELIITIIPPDINFFPFVVSMKMYLIFLALWLSVFMEYVFIITRNNDETEMVDYKKKYKKLYIVYWIINCILALVIIVLPIYFFNENNMKYSYGPSVNVIFALSAFYTVIMLFYIIKNAKHLKKKGYMPIIFLVILLLATAIAQNLNPALLLANASFAFITMLMYHTIENPDIRMIEQLNKNRLLIERHNESKANLLFKITQDVRVPVKEILEISEAITTEKDIDAMKQGAKIINYNAKQLSAIANSVLNVSEIDVKNIRVFETTYNMNNLYNEILLIMKNKMKNDIEFKHDISDSIPEYLYGDATKIKQIICSLLSNSIKNTKEGFIQLNVASIVRYDVCRLLITVEDSGCGMEIENINKILEFDDELSPEDLRNLDKLEIDLKSVKRIINILGGNLIIKSEVNKGSTFTIILDQKIDMEEKNNSDKQINKISKTFVNNKKVLVINDDPKELGFIERILNKNNIEVTTAMYGRESIDKIKAGEQYDLILLDDEMTPDSAVAIYKELKENPKFKIKTIVMLAKNKEFIKEEYLKDYEFTDYLLKNKLKEELEKVINKYIF